jgi:hypothetical protein
MFKNNLINAGSKKVLWYQFCLFVCLDALNINSVGKTQFMANRLQQDFKFVFVKDNACKSFKSLRWNDKQLQSMSLCILPLNHQQLVTHHNFKCFQWIRCCHMHLWAPHDIFANYGCPHKNDNKIKTCYCKAPSLQHFWICVFLIMWRCASLYVTIFNQGCKIILAVALLLSHGKC